MTKISLKTAIIYSFIVVVNLTSCKTSKNNMQSNVKTQDEDLKIADIQEGESFNVEDSYIDSDVDYEGSSDFGFEEQRANPNTKLTKNIKFNSSYKKGSTINEFYWTFSLKSGDSYESKLGICDIEGNVILPNLFNRYPFQISMNHDEVILGINQDYGVFNLETKSWIIPLEYDNLEYLGNSYFIATKNGFKGLIDRNNGIVIPFEWNNIEKIHGLDNLLMVSQPYNNKGIYNIIDKRLSVPNEYQILRKISPYNYFQAVKDQKHTLIDANNKKIFNSFYDEMQINENNNFIIAKKNNLWGVIDFSENIIVPFKYLEFSTYPFNDGSYLVKNSEGKYGCMLYDGKITLPFEYDNIKKSSEYSKTIISHKDGKCGLVMINSGSPKEIVTCDYDSIVPKNEAKCFMIKQNEKYGILDLNGKIILNAEYDSIQIYNISSSYSSEYYFKIVKGKNCNLTNSLGKVIFEESFLDLEFIPTKENRDYATSSSFLKAKNKSGKYCVVDKLGGITTKPIFDEVLIANNFTLVVKAKNKCGLYSLMQKKMILDYTYDNIIYSKGKFYGVNSTQIDFLEIGGQEVKIVPTVN